MKPDPYHIAHLISKYLHGTITTLEEEVLQDWMEESDANKQLFDMLTDEEQSQKSMMFFESLDVDRAWKQMTGKNKPKTNWSKILRKMWYAAAAVTLFVLVGLWWSNTDRLIDGMDAVESNQYKDNDVSPGTKKATLLLSDGRTIDLEGNQHSVNEQDGTTIVNEQGELKYLGVDGGVNELIYNVLEVPKAGMFNLTLSDGTKVWVNAMSELRFPVHFGKEERKVFLKGEAYFEVAHEVERPFHVDVNGSIIEVLGTNFNINAYGSVISTTLVEGMVKVSNPSGEKILSPGQEAKVGEDIIVQPANIEKALAWKQGDFYFKSDNINDIMGQLSRWYDVDVVFKGAYPAKKGYSGAIQRDVNISEVLEMIGYVSGAKFTIEDNTVVVRF